MSLKDFSFEQLDKKARISVGVEKKSEKNTALAKRYCSHNRTCSAYPN